MNAGVHGSGFVAQKNRIVFCTVEVVLRCDSVWSWLLLLSEIIKYETKLHFPRRLLLTLPL